MVKIDLRGPEGNAFYILGTVRNIMKRSGCTKDEIETVMTDMQSADYKHLCDVASRFVKLVGRKYVM